MIKNFTILFLLASLTGFGQTKKVTFNGAGRSVTFHDQIKGNVRDGDSTTLDKSFDGYALFDLGVNIRPNKTTRIETTLRLRNEFSGFWGAGVTLDIRNLYIEGLMKDIIRYRVGDFNFNLTPYTFFNHQEEQTANEAQIFRDFKNILYYESFYNEETWRQQGLSLDFTLESDKIFREMEFMGFFTRTRSSAFFAAPDRFYSGAHWALDQSKYFNFGLNYVNLFDISATYNGSDERFSNSVIAYNGELKHKIEETELSLHGESGFSFVKHKNFENAPEDYSDYFFDFGFTAKLKGLEATLSYRNVGPEYMSAGAQTRRINYATDPFIFPDIDNGERNRPLTLMDMVYDDRLYNTQIDTRLDTFKLQYTNAEPYGVVTPNRTGVTVDVKYTESKKEALDIFLKTSYLSEVIGVGTAEKRNFLLIKGGFDFHINKLFDYDRNITVNLGAQMESTNRGGTEIETVDLSSTLIEAGLEAELVDKLDFLVGAKLFSTNGIEYAAVRDEYNNIFRYNTINIDQKETLLATGLKYRFNENIFLSAQFIKSNWKNNLKDEDSYNINRVLLLFDMRF